MEGAQTSLCHERSVIHLIVLSGFGHFPVLVHEQRSLHGDQLLALW